MQPNTKPLLIVFLMMFSFSVNVFAETDVNIGEIKLLNNKKTKQNTILRELEFVTGDNIDFKNIDAVLSKAQQNLMNTSLFNFVEVKPIWNSDSTQIDVEVDVLERWYIWPVPLFEIADRSFNTWWQDKDYSRLNYGLMMDWKNFSGRNDNLKFLFRFGFEDKYGLFYDIPYITKKQNFGIDFGLSYAQVHEVGVKSVDNELIYFKNDDVYIQRKFDSYFRLVYRPKIHRTQFVEISYKNFDLDGELVNEYPDYTQSGLKQLSFFSLSYHYISDHRDYVAYPLEGKYFDVEVTKMGLNMIQKNGVDFMYVKSNLNYYWKLKDRWFLGAGLLAKLSNNGNQPYVLQRGLGYKKEYIRSYELYVLDGQHYGLLRSNLKYELIPKKVHHFKFIKNEKFSKMFYAFYINLFFDLAYVRDEYNAEANPLVNEILYGYGLGIDYVTYYSLVFRVEVSLNKENETNVFFHVKAPF